MLLDALASLGLGPCLYLLGNTLYNSNRFVIFNIVALLLMRKHPHGVVHRLDSNVTSQDWSP